MISSFPELGGHPEDLARAAFPTLDEAQFARAAAYGRPEEIVEGDLVFDVGDDDADMLLVESGEIEVALGEVHDGPALQARAGSIVGEMNLLTGQAHILSARVVASGVIHRVSAEQFRVLMAKDTELSDLLLRSFLARRQLLVARAGRNLKVIADEASGAGLALRTFLNRQYLPHRWVEQHTAEGRAQAEAAGLTEGDLPAAIMPRVTMRNVEPRTLSHRLGLTFRRTPKGGGRPHDCGRRTGGARRGGLRRVRGARDGAARRGRHGWAGGGQLAHRELPGLPVRAQRRAPGGAGGRAGAEVRRPPGQPVRRGR